MKKIMRDICKKFILIFSFFLLSINISYSDEILSLDDNFFPEGITISRNGDILVGSLKHNKIVKFKNKKEPAETFVSSNSSNLNSVIGIIADNRNKILWACSSNPGVSNYPSDDIVSLKAFDLNSGDLLQSYEFPNGGFCNDIAIDAKGNVYATDSFNPRILRLNKSESRLETWFENEAFEGKGFNLNGITFVDNHIYTVKMNSGELFKIGIADNGKPINFQKINLPRPLNYPDGLKAIDKNNFLVVENRTEGTWTGSLTQIDLSKDVALNILRDNLDTPTTVAIKGNMAWILQAQFSHLFGDEKDVSPDPFEIVGVEFKPSILTKIKKLLNFKN